MVATVEVGDLPVDIVYNEGNGNIYAVNQNSDTVSVIGVVPPPFEGIIGSGNNINIQVQKNTGDNVGGQSDDGNMYSDSPIFQGQSTSQDSSVVS